MSYRILTKTGVDNTNIDGARGEHFNAGMRSGIVKGALNEGSFNSNASNSIYLETCELRICGHRIVLDEPVYKTFSNFPSVNTRYSFVAQIIVDDSSKIEFSLFVQSANARLIQDNLFSSLNGAGTYQLEIGRFTLQTDGTVTDITRTADLITGGKNNGDEGGAFNVGEIVVNTLDPGMEAEVDIEQRVDEKTGKTVTDFHFNIPQGVKGDKGDQGDKGDKGDQGDKGERGEPGQGHSDVYINDELMDRVNFPGEPNNTFWSLQNAEDIPENADLNDYLQSGNYGIKDSNNVATIQHKPSSVTSIFTLKVYASHGGKSGSYPIQEITTFDLQKFIRRYNNDANEGVGAWTDWEAILNYSQLKSEFYSDSKLPTSLSVKDIRDYTDPADRTPFQSRTITPFFTDKNMPTSGWWSGLDICGWNQFPADEEGDHYRAWQMVSSSSNNDTAIPNICFRQINKGVESEWVEAVTVRVSDRVITQSFTLPRTGYQTYNGHGYRTDEWGNFKHLRDVNTDTFHIDGYDGSENFVVNFETGETKIKGNPVEVIETNGVQEGSGYIFYSSGLQICWGVTEQFRGTKHINFPIVFSDSRLMSIAVARGPGTYDWDKTQIMSYDYSGFDVRVDSNTGAFMWIAIGHGVGTPT